MGNYFPGGTLSRSPADWFTSDLQTGFAAPGAVAGENSGVLLFSDAVDGSYLWVWAIDGLTAPSSTVWCQVIEPIFFGVGSRGFMLAPNTVIGPGLVTGLVRPQTLPFGNFFPLF